MDLDLTVLELDIVDAVARVTLRNPPVNALDARFLADFERVVATLGPPGPARAVLVRSDCPGFFSAGDDVRELRDERPAVLDLLPRAHALLDALEALALPTVAAINGHALGGGLELALACDLRIQGAGSGRVGLPEVRLGMMPALGGTQRLPRLVGYGRALEMMMKGLQLEADEAERIGLVTRVVPADELEDLAQDYARRLARQATGALARIKRAMQVGAREGMERGLAEERRLVEENFTSPDVREGVGAFLEGRRPEFRGRA